MENGQKIKNKVIDLKCSKLKILMLGRRQAIFSTPYFQFEKGFDFLFVYVMNLRDDRLRLASWKTA